jgi:hypothetical protein
MKVEYEGGPADGMQDEAPEDITAIFLDDIGPARPGTDPFDGASLGRMTYEITSRKGTNGAIIFRYVQSSTQRRVIPGHID